MSLNARLGAVLDWLREADIPLDVRRTSLRWSLQCGTFGMLTAVAYAGAKELRGYGALGEGAAALLGHVQQDLGRLIDRVAAYLRQQQLGPRPLLGVGDEQAERSARARIGRVVWIAVGLATLGLGVLSLQGFAIGGGEALTLASALLYGAHIVGLGVWSSARSAIGLTVVQLLTITVVCGAAAAPGGVVLPQTGGDWFALVYMALVAGALALVVQTWAQAHLPPTRTAIIMSMEPVFAALFAVLLGGEDATLRMLVGGSMVLAAMLIVELSPRRKVEAEVTHIAV